MTVTLRWYGDRVAKQVAFGTARGLTQVAKAAAFQVTRELPEVFDRPTPYTMRSIGMEPATRENQVAKVFVRPDQLAYLEREIMGGERTPKPGSPVNVPVDAKLNQYGNIPRKGIKRYLAQKDTFSADGTGKTYHLKPGIYRRAERGERRNGGKGTKGPLTQGGSGKRVGGSAAKGATSLDLLVAFKPRATYSKRFGFVKMTEDAVRPMLSKTVQASIDQALATAR